MLGHFWKNVRPYKLLTPRLMWLRNYCKTMVLSTYLSCFSCRQMSPSRTETKPHADAWNSASGWSLGPFAASSSRRKRSLEQISKHPICVVSWSEESHLTEWELIILLVRQSSYHGAYDWRARGWTLRRAPRKPMFELSCLAGCSVRVTVHQLHLLLKMSEYILFSYLNCIMAINLN